MLRFFTSFNYIKEINFKKIIWNKLIENFREKEGDLRKKSFFIFHFTRQEQDYLDPLKAIICIYSLTTIYFM